jgi:hypothetical protein
MATRPIRFYHRGAVVEIDAASTTRTVLDWLREADPRLATRFAFMTGGALTPSARAALEGSGVPSLEKPFGRDAVVALLDSLAPTC